MSPMPVVYLWHGCVSLLAPAFVATQVLMYNRAEQAWVARANVDVVAPEGTGDKYHGVCLGCDLRTPPAPGSRQHVRHGFLSWPFADRLEAVGECYPEWTGASEIGGWSILPCVMRASGCR